MLDFFGLGQPGIGPQNNEQKINEQDENAEQNDQFQAANHMLNIYLNNADVDGRALDAWVQPAQEQPMEVIDLHIPASMDHDSIDIGISGQVDGGILPDSYEQEVNQPEVEIPIVLSLQANPIEPINFLHLEIQSHVLNALDSPDLTDETISIDSDQARLMPDLEGDSFKLDLLGDQNASNNLQVGMVLLPESLDCDPSLEDHCTFGRGLIDKSKQGADGVRLWVKHFAPLGHAEGIHIPNLWCNFFTVCLLNPDRFEWVKSFMNSKAWTMILKDREIEATITFSLPHTCNIEDQLHYSEGGPVDEVFRGRIEVSCRGKSNHTLNCHHLCIDSQ
jgi:hypothetical protein